MITFQSCFSLILFLLESLKNHYHVFICKHYLSLKMKSQKNSEKEKDPPIHLWHQQFFRDTSRVKQNHKLLHSIPHGYQTLLHSSYLSECSVASSLSHSWEGRFTFKPLHSEHSSAFHPLLTQGFFCHAGDVKGRNCENGNYYRACDI